jgi:F-type H+-transporting ATPase subunit b
MDSLISTFNIDLKLLVAQVINFAIVFAVLYYFALRPLMRVMRERSDKIEKSLADASAVEAKLAAAEGDYNKKLNEAKLDAAKIMAASREQGEVTRANMIKKAKEEIGEIINAEKEKMQQEKARTLKEIKAEIGGLVILAVEKVLEKKIDGREDKELIKKITSEK